MFSTYFILFNVFILLSSKENKREFQDFSRLKVTSVVNIILPGALFFIPNATLSSPYSQMEELLFFGIYLLRSSIFFIPLIYTMGLIFFFIGTRHKEQFGNFLKYSGLAWTFYSIWAAIFLYNPELPSPFLFPLLRFMGILNYPFDHVIQIILSAIGSIGNIFGYIFFMVHAYFNKDKNLKIAGFVYIIGQSLMILGMIPFYISVWL